MASRALTSIAIRYSLPLLCRRLQASNFCLMTRAPEAHKGSTKIDGVPPESCKSSRKIEGALPRNMDGCMDYKFPYGCYLPKGYYTPPYIYLYDMMIGFPTSSPKPKPDPDVFILHFGKDCHYYFTAHSVGEDGTITPKYYLSAPSRLYGRNGYFSGANCNGVFHYQKMYPWWHYLWNPKMDWIKTLPMSPDKMPGISRASVVDYAIWCDDHKCQDYKVMQLVEDYRELEDFELPYVTLSEMMAGDADRTTYHFELYSSRTNSWMILDCKTEFRPLPCSTSACLDGVFYFPAYHGADDVFLLCFDFATETFSTLPLPDECNRFRKYRIVEFKGMLSVFVSNKDEMIPSKFEHYVMVNGKWVNNYDLYTCGVQCLVCFSRDGEVLYFEGLNDELGMFNLNTREIKRLGVYCFSRPIELHPAS